MCLYASCKWSSSTGQHLSVFIREIEGGGVWSLIDAQRFDRKDLVVCSPSMFHLGMVLSPCFPKSYSISSFQKSLPSFLKSLPDFPNGYLGNRVYFFGNWVDFLGNWVDFSWNQVGFSGNLEGFLGKGGTLFGWPKIEWLEARWRLSPNCWASAWTTCWRTFDVVHEEYVGYSYDFLFMYHMYCYVRVLFV